MEAMPEAMPEALTGQADQKWHTTSALLTKILPLAIWVEMPYEKKFFHQNTVPQCVTQIVG